VPTSLALSIPTTLAVNSRRSVSVDDNFRSIGNTVRIGQYIAVGTDDETGADAPARGARPDPVVGTWKRRKNCDSGSSPSACPLPAETRDFLSLLVTLTFTTAPPAAADQTGKSGSPVTRPAREFLGQPRFRGSGDSGARRSRSSGDGRGRIGGPARPRPRIGVRTLMRC